jgi:5'-phosphate synthase pdxT subunit
VFGTCAGCILLSDRVSSVLGGGDNHKKSDVITLDSAALYGEQHVGGMDITTCRNFFGRQTKSFASKCNSKDAAFDGFTCVFIRAPAIASVGQMATKLATVKHGESETIVAARQGNLLGTCFHPELTNDDRIHRYFIGMVQEYFQKHSK